MLPANVGCKKWLLSPAFSVPVVESWLPIIPVGPSLTSLTCFDQGKLTGPLIQSHPYRIRYPVPLWRRNDPIRAISAEASVSNSGRRRWGKGVCM